jgi:metacaspase-1
LKKALCVGISRFADPYTSPLAGGANDALLLATMLQQRYNYKRSDVRLLTDEAATTPAIMAGLEWLTAGAAPGDVLVFTLATHGTRNIDYDAPPGPAGEVGGNERIFLTYDSSVSNYLFREDVAAMLDRAPAGAHCYCIIDTCDVGPFYYAKRLDISKEGRGAEHSDPDVQCSDVDNARRLTGRVCCDDVMNRVEITACAEHEQSFDMPENTDKHGLLTLSLYQTLEKYTWDATVNTVYEEVRSRVITIADSMKVKQTPQLYGRQRLMKHKIFS